MPVDPATITTTLLRDRAKLLAYINAIVRDHHVAEDVLQEVSLLAIEKAEQIMDADTLIPWLRVASRYRALKAVEKRGKQAALRELKVSDTIICRSGQIRGRESYTERWSPGCGFVGVL